MHKTNPDLRTKKEDPARKAVLESLEGDWEAALNEYYASALKGEAKTNHFRPMFDALRSRARELDVEPHVIADKASARRKVRS